MKSDPTPNSRYKLAARIWEPVLAKLNQRLEAACLRRDAWLARVLEHEIPEVQAEVDTPNSPAARDFIAAHLDLLPRKLVTFALPEDLVRQLDELCATKRIVRDSLLNRLFLLLLGNRDLQTKLFFDVADWFPRTLERSGLSSEAAGEMLSSIPDFRDPFLAVRAGQAVWRAQLARELGSVELANQRLREHGIYTAPLTASTLGQIDLFGLNVYFPDVLVPGTADHASSNALLDEFLARPSDPPR